MPANTATVETLTAEVRVLIVGSRQVTLSVYGQLDMVDPDEVEPFGRVRPRDARPGYIHIVGKHHQTGALVGAVAPAGKMSIAGKLLAWIEGIREAEREAKRLTEAAQRSEAFESSTHHMDNHHHCIADQAKQERLGAENAADEAAILRIEYDEQAAELGAQAAELAKLPLIVLAGLR